MKWPVQCFNTVNDQTDKKETAQQDQDINMKIKTEKMHTKSWINCLSIAMKYTK